MHSALSPLEPFPLLTLLGLPVWVREKKIPLKTSLLQLSAWGLLQVSHKSGALLIKGKNSSICSLGGAEEADCQDSFPFSLCSLGVLKVFSLPP